MVTAKELYAIYKEAQDRTSVTKSPTWDSLLCTEQRGWEAVASKFNERSVKCRERTTSQAPTS